VKDNIFFAIMLCVLSICVICLTSGMVRHNKAINSMKQYISNQKSKETVSEELQNFINNSSKMKVGYSCEEFSHACKIIGNLGVEEKQ